MTMRGFGFEAELLDRRVEGVLEDELLDEFWGLQQGVVFWAVSDRSW